MTGHQELIDFAKKVRLHANFLETHAGRNADHRAIAEDLRKIDAFLSGAGAQKLPSALLDEVVRVLRPFAALADSLVDAHEGPVGVVARHLREAADLLTRIEQERQK